VHSAKHSDSEGMRDGYRLVFVLGLPVSVAWLLVLDIVSKLNIWM